jgi:hypothetical protein
MNENCGTPTSYTYGLGEESIRGLKSFMACIDRDYSRMQNNYYYNDRSANASTTNIVNTMKNTALTLRIDSDALLPGVDSRDMILGFYKQVRSLELKHMTLDFAISLLDIVFSISLRRMLIHRSILADARNQIPYRRDKKISNYSLAALPFSPSLLMTALPESFYVSREGAAFISAQDQMMAQFGGWRNKVTTSTGIPHPYTTDKRSRSADYDSY